MTVRFGEMHAPDFIGSFGAAATAIRGHLTWTSPVLRHAVRLSTTVALAIAAARFGGVSHGYWIALTVLIVLRPETAHTYTRCVGRIAGIAVGITVSSVLTMFWQPTGSAAVVIAAAFVAVTYAMARFGYVAVSAALAASIVFLLDIDAAAAGATIEDRLFAVVLGGGLALVAHVVLPDHALIRLRQRAGELLNTEIDYAATVVKAFVHEIDHPADTLSAAWQRAYRARAAFEAATGATRLDSLELRRWLRSYRAALNVVTSSCTCHGGQSAECAVDRAVPRIRRGRRRLHRCATGFATYPGHPVDRRCRRADRGEPAGARAWREVGRRQRGRAGAGLRTGDDHPQPVRHRRSPRSFFGLIQRSMTRQLTAA